MELLAYLVVDTISGARELLAILVTDSLNLTAQGQAYVDRLASMLRELVNSTAQALDELLF